MREMDGEYYRFRCIDQNYSDKMDTHRQTALFFCDTVIPANHGSEYVFEETADGTHQYVFYPGPIVNFGSSNDYKYSNIRQWLKVQGDDFAGAEPVSAGVFHAYTGSTQEGMYSQLHASALGGSYIGSQKMTDRLFVLSVDEALKYRDWLWRFEGAAEENPETQYGAFSKGYWLRNPMGSATEHDTGFVYTVDLVRGTIAPSPVEPERDGETDAELQVTGSIGVRPAFAMPQDMWIQDEWIQDERKGEQE